MSFHGDMFDDEAAMLSLLLFSESSEPSPEPCNPSMQQQHQHQVQQQQHQVQRRRQQQLGNSHHTWLPGDLLNESEQYFLGQSMLNSIQESSDFTMNQIEFGQQIGQESNGFSHPTMTNFHEFPNHLQEQLLPVHLIQQESFDAFGSLFPQHLRRFPNNNVLAITTASMTTTTQNLVHMQQQQQHHPYGHTLSIRELMLNNQYHNAYNLDQIMVANSEQSSPITPNNFIISNRSQTNLPYQTYRYVPSTYSSVSLYGQQLSPSVLANRPSEPRNLSMVNNSARYHGRMKRSVHPSSSSFRFSNLNTQTRRRPYTNSIIPPQSGVLESRRRSYQSRFEFEESSSFTQRRRIISADGNVGSTAANGNVGSTAVNLAVERLPDKIYDPLYESLGLRIDPHLRKFSRTRNGR